jgi:hypothetical protein
MAHRLSNRHGGHNDKGIVTGNELPLAMSRADPVRDTVEPVTHHDRIRHFAALN